MLRYVCEDFFGSLAQAFQVSKLWVNVEAQEGARLRDPARDVGVAHQKGMLSGNKGP